MDSKMLLQSNYLDIIFDGRNKQYGSYELRSTYAQRMRKAGFFIFSVALLFTGYTMWANKTKALPLMPLVTKQDTIVFENPLLDIPDEPITPPAVPLSNPDLNTIKLTLPDVVDDNLLKPEHEVPDQSDLTKAVVDVTTSVGDDMGSASLGNGDGKPDGDRGDILDVNGGGGGHKITSPEIPVFVEQMPEFPGGEAALLKYLADNIQYPKQAVDAGKEGQVRVKFVVNADGTVTQVNTTRGFGFGSEKEAIRVVSGMPKWKPGRNNGVAVPVWFQIPVLFSLN